MCRKIVPEANSGKVTEITMKSMVSEAAPATPDQQQHVTEMITSPVALMVEKYLDTHNGAVRFVGHGTEVTNDVRDFVRDLVRKYGTANQFANEEVASNYTYPVEYRGPKPLVTQIKALAKTLGLNPESALAYAENLPKLDSLKGWFAFSRTEALASITSQPEDEEVSLEEQYCRGVNFVLGKLGESRSFYNYREGQIVPERLRQLDRTLEGLTLLSKMQGDSDILVAPFQLGMSHRGCSTRRARERFVGNEYGATSMMGACIALTHPERFVRFEELDMDLPGDEFDDPVSDVRFDHAPFLFFHGRLRFVAGRVDFAFQLFGSASWFLPQV